MGSFFFKPATLFLFLLPSLAMSAIVTRLIHYQSIHSPFFGRSYEFEDSEISHARLIQLKYRKKMTPKNFSESLLDTAIFSKTPLPLFYVVLNVGFANGLRLGVPQMLALDTGSSLLWVHCGARGGDKAPYRRYSTRMSSTYYRARSCRLCNTRSQPVCQAGTDSCAYEAQYFDGNWATGILGYEVFTFNSTNIDRPVEQVWDTVFGCTTDTKSPSIFDNYNGVLGLGLGQISLISQLQTDEFSYCIANVSDIYSNENFLAIGQPEFKYGYFVQFQTSTPMVMDGRHYGATLIGISFGETRLDIDESELRAQTTTFDTGASLSYLGDIAYTKLERAVVDWVGDYLQRYFLKKDHLCYEGDLYEDFAGFPVVTFHFAEDARLYLDAHNIFRQETDRLVCMKVLNSEVAIDRNLIGVNLQQYSYITYDILNKRIRMARADCASMISLIR